MIQKENRITRISDRNTGANIYRIEGSEKTALIDCGAMPQECYEGVDHLIINNCTPACLDGIKELVKHSPDVIVTGAAHTIGFVQEYTKVYFRTSNINISQKLELGGISITAYKIQNVIRSRHQNRTWRKHYKYLKIPNWQWMDTVVTLCPEEHAAFTGEIFSNTDGDMKDYFIDHQNAFRTEITKGIKRLAELPAEIALPAYGGPVDYAKAIEAYSSYIEELKANRNSVLMVYTSRLGMTERLAAKIYEGFNEAGGLNIEKVRLTEKNLQETADRVYNAGALIVGTPTIEEDADPVMRMFLAKLNRTMCAGKTGAVFGNYSYSPKGIGNTMERMKQLDMKIIETAFGIRFEPDDNELALAEEYGQHLADCILNGEVKPFVHKEPEKALPEINTDKRFLIIGSGAAGTTVAQELRAVDKTAEITIIGREPYSGYNRQILSKGIFDELTHDRLKLKKEDWFEENRIRTVFGVSADKIDHNAKTVYCSDGETRSYDKLICCAGSRAFVPDVPGAGLEGIFPMHDLAEVQALHEYIETHEVKNIVIAGAGILGMEIARDINKSGGDHKVTVVERADILLPGHIDETASEILADKMESAGIQTMTGRSVAGFKGSRIVERVVFEDSTELEAELVILCLGIKENTEALLEGGGPIPVDIFMQTEYEDVYACGDCAAYRNVNTGLWTQALEQAKVAASNAAGIMKKYTPVVPDISFTGFDTVVYSIGSTSGLVLKNCQTKIHNDPYNESYKRYIYAGGMLKCGILMGVFTDEVTDLIELWKKQNEE